MVTRRFLAISLLLLAALSGLLVLVWQFPYRTLLISQYLRGGGVELKRKFDLDFVPPSNWVLESVFDPVSGKTYKFGTIETAERPYTMATDNQNLWFFWRRFHSYGLGSAHTLATQRMNEADHWIFESDRGQEVMRQHPALFNRGDGFTIDRIDSRFTGIWFPGEGFYVVLFHSSLADEAGDIAREIKDANSGAEL